MILWTIQTEAGWREFRSRGVLRGTRERIIEDSWRGAYLWMVEQMRRRIGQPSLPTSYPIWAWFQFESPRRAKPDLRSTGYLPKGEAGIRIEFECPDEAAVLSDFQLWHYVLNYWYLPETEEEGERFEAEVAQHGLSFFDTKPLADPYYHKRIVKSWEKIFDLDWSENELVLPRSKKSIQATVWEVAAEQVKNEKHFKAR